MSARTPIPPGPTVSVRLTASAAHFLMGTSRRLNELKALPEGSDEALQTSAWLEEIEDATRRALSVAGLAP